MVAFNRCRVNPRDIPGSIAALEQEIARALLQVGSETKSSVALRTSSITASDGDFVDFEDLTSAVKVYLPSAPSTGATVYVKAAPNSTTYNVTVDGNGKNIDGASTFVMYCDNMSAGFKYTGKQWRVF